MQITRRGVTSGMLALGAGAIAAPAARAADDQAKL
jgi:hypothetical protein